MKKNTVKLFVLALALGSSLVVSAQDKKRATRKFETNVEALKILGEKYSKRYTADYEKAVALAKINNWPLEIKKDNGVYMALISVDSEGQPVYMMTHNEESAITSRVDKLHPGGSSGLGLTGMYPGGNEDRISIGVWDGQYPQVTHPEFVGRFASLEGPISPTQDHPTHVLGTILASGNDPAARGMAYEAFGIVANFNNDTSEMAIAAGDGMILSNHSYGIPSAPKGVYLADFAMEVDEITFSAPYYQPVFSAGNDNGTPGTYDLISDKAIAKNVITVGATYKLDWINQTTPVISTFSSWGPVDDNRIKPDISTDGVDVYSTLPSAVVGQALYGLMSGTSMSSPGVTGSLALIQQYYAERHTEDLVFGEKVYMLSSTLRALVAHCATEAGNVGPDAKFGWGMLDAAKMADVITKEGEETILYENVLQVNEDYEIEVEALGGQPLVVTLAWTDPAPVMAAGTSISSAIVNNLDLRVVKVGGATSLPWKLAATPSSPAVKGDNNVDTTEKIEIAGASGTYKIQVSHKGTTLKNPTNPQQPQQVYSLVVSGINATLDSKDFTKDGFSVWPNPAKGRLNISMASVLENGAKATIYDVQGRVVLQSGISATDTELNIGNLTAGVYFVNVANGNKSEVKKFIVE